MFRAVFLGIIDIVPAHAISSLYREKSALEAPGKPGLSFFPP